MFIEVKRLIAPTNYIATPLDTTTETLNIEEICRFSPSSIPGSSEPVTSIELKNASTIKILQSYDSLKKLFQQNHFYV